MRRPNDPWLPGRYVRHEEPKPVKATLANWRAAMDATIPASDICCPVRPPKGKSDE